MASSSTLSAWGEELALSLQKSPLSSHQKRKLRDTFNRKLRYHNFGRTNQFEVVQKLDGLEEKFQVLNHDDLSDAIRTRRLELALKDENWIPEMLDLLLRLSKDPLGMTDADVLSNAKPRVVTPPPLRWEDVEVDDPFDRQNQIWRIPDYSDFSSDEDEAIQASAATSPVRGAELSAMRDQEYLQNSTLFFDKVDDDDLAEKCLDGNFSRKAEESVILTQLQAVRQIICLLHGLPSPLFIKESGVLSPNSNFTLSGVNSKVFDSVLSSIIALANTTSRVRSWTETKGRTVDCMQRFHDRVNSVILEFDTHLSRVEQEILDTSSHGGLVSFQRVLNQTQLRASPMLRLDKLLRDSYDGDTVDVLENLFDHVCQAQICGESEEYTMLQSIFVDVFEVYSRPIENWLHQGVIESRAEDFFIVNENDHSNKGDLWHKWYKLSPSNTNRAPDFLRHLVPDIFAAGKTAAFLKQFSKQLNSPFPTYKALKSVIESILVSNADDQAPFSTTFQRLLQEYVYDIHQTAAHDLMVILENDCGFDLVLDAFSHLYLGKLGNAVDQVESKIFSNIDHCLETWNDRFLVADSMEAAYENMTCLDVGRVVVLSTYTSSRSMESRRRSVKILGALSFDYTLSWPVANIILPESLTSYRRLALFLCQIRRARYILDRMSYFFVQKVPLGISVGEQKCAQGLHFSLLLFVNSLYNHLTTCVVEPMTRKMRTELTGTVDEMIHVHSSYVRNLEYACLTSQKLRIIKDAIVSILDLCIRFSDIVCASSISITKSSDDIETGSFISALSRERRRNRASSLISESDEEEYEPEGYSTFILDEHTTIQDEVKKITTQFTKHVSFLVAGLRGVAKSSKDVGDYFELLADRLDCGFDNSSVPSS